jgi:response regulator RpfG family c-di-GMP phosphodiesterase
MKNIALIDDDPINNLICKKKMQKNRADLSIAEFLMARRGLEYFLQKPTPTVDLLLLDINMPDLDAWTFLDEIMKYGLSVPVVIITSSIDQDDMDKAKNYAMIIDYIIKPITEEKIVIILSHLS